MNIELKNIEFKYKNFDSGIFDVSFNVAEGESIAIVEVNGSGKTTILNK